MKPIRHHAHIKNVAAYLILDKQGNEAFTVHARRISVANYQVDVWDTTHVIFQGKGESLPSILHGQTIGGVQLFEECTPHPKSAQWIDKMKSMSRTKRSYFDARLIKKYGARYVGWAVYYIAGIQRMESFGYKIIRVL